MSRRQEWKRAGVNNAQVLRPVDTRLAVYHGHAVVGAAHLAGRGRVVDGHKTGLDIGKDVGVGGHVEAGEVFFVVGSDVVLSEDGPNLAGAFEALDSDFLVRGVGEPIRVENRRVRHVGARDGDITSGEGG